MSQSVKTSLSVEFSLAADDFLQSDSDIPAITLKIIYLMKEFLSHFELFLECSEFSFQSAKNNFPAFFAV